MDAPRNRGSPRLQFTKEELEDSTLSKPIAKAEKAADKYEKAKGKLKKRYQLKLTREEMEASKASKELRAEESNHASLSSDDANPFEPDQEIRTDPNSPGVRNTREKPQSRRESTSAQKPGSFRNDENRSGGSQNSSAQPTGSASHHAAKAESSIPTSEAGVKKKVYRLKFEEAQAKKPSRLSHPVQKTIKTAEDQLHRQIVQANEDDNIAVDAVLQADNAGQTALQAGEHAFHARAVHQYKKAWKAEKQLDKANIQFMEARQRQANPQFTSNPLSRWQQKRAIRKEYAAIKAGRNSPAQSAAKGAERAVETVRSKAARAIHTLRRRPVFVPVLILGAVLLILVGSLQSFIPMAQSILESVAVGSYPASEEDVRAAEEAYLKLEQELQDEMDNYLKYHPEYDDYEIVQADKIWHDPYVLIAIISACFDGQEWNIETAMPVLERYFHRQYVKTETVTSETRHRMETKTGTRTVTDPITGKKRTETYTYEEEVAYTHKTAHVTLENKNLSHLPVETMSVHRLGLYALYMSSHGNMEGIFTGPYAEPLKDPMIYDIPQETLDADPEFAKLMEEANKYVGYPYVWGGSIPETSFDCSGFVSYVFTNSGVYNIGRLGATGLFNLCREVPDDEAKPGDIVFFEGTMGGVPGITHCGIYVGENMMIHCGNPIGYANLNDSYWREHFHSFGRVPK